MHEKRKILNIEKSLGFKWERGLSRKKSLSCEVRIVRKLLEEVEPLKKGFRDYLPSQLRDAPDFAQRCEELFLKYGPQLWPSSGVDRSEWLVDAEENDWGGLYPNNLFYANATERDALRRNFRDLIFEKCVRYHENCKQKFRRERDGASPETQQENPVRNHEDTAYTSRKDIYSFDDDSDFVSHAKSSPGNPPRRGPPNTALLVGFKPAMTFAAPVAPMFGSEEEASWFPVGNEMSRREDYNTPTAVPRERGLDFESEQLHSTRANTTLPPINSNSRSPGSVSKGSNLNAPRPDGVARHKHPNPLDLEIENPSSKRIKLSNAPEMQKAPFSRIVKLKIDGVKLASITQTARESPTQQRTARKRPVSYSSRPNDDVGGSEAQYGGSPSPSHAQILSGRTELAGKVPTTGWKPARVSNPEDEPDATSETRNSPQFISKLQSRDVRNNNIRESFVDLTQDQEHPDDQRYSVEPDERSPKRLSARIRIPSTKSSLDQLRKAYLRNTARQTETHDEYVRPPTREKTTENTQASGSTVSGLGTESEAHRHGSARLRESHINDATRQPHSSYANTRTSVSEELPAQPVIEPLQRAQLSNAHVASDTIHSGGTARPTSSAWSQETVETVVQQPALLGSPSISHNARLSPPARTDNTTTRSTVSREGLLAPEAPRSEQINEVNLGTELHEPTDKAPYLPKPGTSLPSYESGSVQPVGLTFNAEAQPTMKAQPATALERARTAVYWDRTSDCPNFIDLRHCKTHQDLFALLLRRRPPEFKQNAIEAIEIRLTNPEATGITESPNCRIAAEDDEASFEYLLDVLGECTANVRPKLKLTVEFQD